MQKNSVFHVCVGVIVDGTVCCAIMPLMKQIHNGSLVAGPEADYDSDDSDFNGPSYGAGSYDDPSSYGAGPASWGTPCPLCANAALPALPVYVSVACLFYGTAFGVVSIGNFSLSFTAAMSLTDIHKIPLCFSGRWHQ